MTRKLLVPDVHAVVSVAQLEQRSRVFASVVPADHTVAISMLTLVQLTSAFHPEWHLGPMVPPAEASVRAEKVREVQVEMAESKLFGSRFQTIPMRLDGSSPLYAAVHRDRRVDISDFGTYVHWIETGESLKPVPGEMDHLVLQTLRDLERTSGYSIVYMTSDWRLASVARDLFGLETRSANPSVPLDTLTN